MASARSAKSTRVKVQEHRERLRVPGLDPSRFWVPDVRAAAFRSEAHRQWAAVAASARSAKDHAFIDPVWEWGDK